MVIVGYGDVGAACAEIAKYGYDMEITIVTKKPDLIK